MKRSNVIEAGDWVKHKTKAFELLVMHIDPKEGRVHVGGREKFSFPIAACVLVEKGDALSENELKYRKKLWGH